MDASEQRLGILIADDHPIFRRGLIQVINAEPDLRVVAEAADVDTCLLLGAGFPFWLGGITKHLDQQGISERVVGAPFASRTAAPQPVA